MGMVLNNNTRVHDLINHRVEVLKIAKCKWRQNKDYLAIDINRYGIAEAGSDCENHTVYRRNLFSLSIDTFNEPDDNEILPHYPNAQYRSIHDY